MYLLQQKQKKRTIHVCPSELKPPPNYMDRSTPPHTHTQIKQTEVKALHEARKGRPLPLPYKLMLHVRGATGDGWLHWAMVAWHLQLLVFTASDGGGGGGQRRRK
jgi:hypothetical protein